MPLQHAHMFPGLLGTILESIPARVFWKDRDSRYLGCNTAFARDAGLAEPRQILGKTDHELGWHEQAERYRADDRAIMESGQPRLSYEEPQTTPEGARIWLRTSKSPLRDALGGVIGVLGIYDDITAQHAQRRALLETRALHEEAQRIARLGHWRLDHRDRAMSVSDETFRIFGIDLAPRAPSVARFFRAMHPDDRRAVSDAFQHAVRTRAPFDLDHRVVTPDGEVRWVKERGETTYADDGQPLRSTGTVMDITDLKRAEERTRSSLDFLGKIIAHAAEGIAVLHLDGAPHPQFSVWNDRLASITGYTRDEVNRLGFGEALFPDPERRRAAEASVRDAYRGVGPQHQPWEIATRTGERRTLSLSSSRVTLEDGQPALVLLAQDVTERLRAAQEHERLRAQLNATQRLESVGRLAGGVAHDFNNMLGVIIGRTQLAMEHLDPESPARADLLEILEAAQRSAELTHQLLAFARRQTVAPVELDLDEKITGLLKMLRRLIGEGITLEWVPSAGLRRVRIDPSQVDQVLTNLCINARDAISGVGTVRIETQNVTVQRPDDDGGPAVPRESVCVAISDTGRGMDESVITHLFEPFFTTKGVGQGTGLGLATVYGIVKQNGGHIEVHSAPGAGSTFRIYLPAVTAEAAPATDAPSIAPPPRGDGTVLLVEDEPAVMRVTHRFLERLGYHVIAADSPTEALRLAAAHDGGIDLLLTDVIMPELSGGDLARHVRALHPEVRVIFMSGYTADELAPHGVLAPGVDFLQKPFAFHDFAARVHARLSQAR
ncbi:MAG: PAS domain S-box protein [Polyangiales bacterium]